MSEDLLIGLAATGVPLLVLGFLILRRNPAIFRFFVALLLVGLGYLAVTDALSDIGRIVQGKDSPVVEPAAAESPTPRNEQPAADEPKPAPIAPADAPVGEPAPAPIETQPQDAEPEPESMPPPPDTGPADGATQPDSLPPANP